MVIGLFYWIFYSLILLVAYHKIFTVYYLDFSGGLLRELLISGLLGAVLAGLSILYWQFGVIVIVLLALIAIAKAESAFLTGEALPRWERPMESYRTDCCWWIPLYLTARQNVLSIFVITMYAT